MVRIDYFAGPHQVRRKIMAIQKRWTMLNSDICEVGEKLGFEWNAVVEEIQNQGFYAEEIGRAHV